MMRDDDFRFPLSRPMEGLVVRYTSGAGGFTDHGFDLKRSAIKREESKDVNIRQKQPIQPKTTTRMHTIDFTTGPWRRGR